MATPPPLGDLSPENGGSSLAFGARRDEVRSGAVFGDEEHQYEIGELLGHGSFAKVYKCRDVATNEEYAVKVVSLNKMRFSSDFEGQQRMLLREVEILCALRHQRIVNLQTYKRTDEYWYLVMELVCHGELFHCIKPNKGMKGFEARHVFLQLLEGIGYIHAQGIIHRDLKPENVLIVNHKPAEQPLDGTYYDVKIADFGLGKVHSDGLSPARSCVGSPVYAAPEVYKAGKNGGTYDHAVDMWSLGAVLYVMLCGLYPFEVRRMPKETLLSCIEKVAVRTTSGVEAVQLRLRDGQVDAHGARDGPLETANLDSNELLVAVTQEHREGDGSLGTSVTFYTSSRNILHFSGDEAPRRQRFAAPRGEQICGLEFESGCLVGVKTVALATSRAGAAGVFSEIRGRSGSYVDSVELQLRSGELLSYGDEGGSECGPWALEVDELVVFVVQECSESYLGASLTFITSAGNIIRVEGSAARPESRFSVPRGRQIGGLRFEGGRLAEAQALPEAQQPRCADFKMDASVWKRNVHEHARQVVQSLLQLNPKKRASVEECLEMPWLADSKSEFIQFIRKGSSPTLVESAAHLARVPSEPSEDESKEGTPPAAAEASQDAAPATPPRAVQRTGAVAQIRGRLYSAVDRVELHLRCGLVRCYGGHGGQSVGPWSLGSNEIITAVAQEARNTDLGYLGNSLVFYTSVGRAIALEGSYAEKVHRHAAPAGYQICGLFFDGSRLSGVQTIALPEVQAGQATNRGLVSKICGRSAEAVDRVELHLKDGTANVYGGDGGEPQNPWLLHSDEYIIAVQQEHRDEFLGNAITFLTSMGSVVSVDGSACRHHCIFVAPAGTEIWGLHFEGSQLVEALNRPLSPPAE